MRINHEAIKKEFLTHKMSYKIVLSFITIFEIILIIRGILVFDFKEIRSSYYMILYVLLLIFTLFALLVILSKKPKAEMFFKKYGFIYLYFYNIFILVWATLISYLDMTYGATAIVFYTVLMGIAIFCIIDPFIYTFICFLSSVVIAILSYKYFKYMNDGFLINNLIYCLIAVIASFRNYSILLNENKFKNKLSIQAKTDHLTTLLNRRALDNRIEKLKNNKQHFYLILFDINNFKQANDLFGHKFGDDCLVMVAKYLKEEFGELNSYRFGGDEFAVITTLEEKYVKSKISIINNKLKDNIDNIEIKLSAGIYLASLTDSEKEIFIRADLALYEAKNNSTIDYASYKK